MKKTKKILAIFLALLIIIALMAGCGPSDKDTPSDSGTSDSGTSDSGTTDSGNSGGGDYSDRIDNIIDIYDDNNPIKIGYIPMSTLGVSNALVTLAQEDFKTYYPNLSIETFEVTYDTATQISTVQECITQGFNGIIMEATDAAALANAVESAEEAGIPVITQNCGCEGVHSAQFEGNDYDSGVVIAKALVEQLGGKGKVIVLDCPAEAVAFSRMGTGFVDYVEANCPDIEIIDHQFIANWQKEEANTVMRDLLTKYPEVDGIYGVNDDIALGAVQAIESAGREGDGILVWGRSGFPDAFDAIKDGRMAGTCCEDFYQEASSIIATMLYFIDSGITAYNLGYEETPAVAFPLFTCTAENVDVVESMLRWDVVGM